MSTDINRATGQNRLQDVHDTLTGEFERQTARLAQLTADTGDPAEAHTRSAMITATRQSLDQITGALRRITEGRYGVCERCDRDIPSGRLEILPQARFCVPCQERQNA